MSKVPMVRTSRVTRYTPLKNMNITGISHDAALSASLCTGACTDSAFFTQRAHHQCQQARCTGHHRYFAMVLNSSSAGGWRLAFACKAASRQCSMWSWINVFLAA